MPRLTVPPNFIGTSGVDTLAAQDLNVSGAIGIDILNPGMISTFSGNDSITGTGTVNLKTDSGNDSITGTSTGIVILKPIKLSGGTGIGINNSGTLNTGSGGDTITGTGTGGNGGKNFFASFGYSIPPGSIPNDVLVFDLNPGRNGVKGGTGTGISNSGSFDAGDGNDTITGTGTGGTGGEASFKYPLINSTIYRDGLVILESRRLDETRGESGAGGTGIGISNSDKLNTGKGEDTLIGTGTTGRNNEIGTKSSIGGTGIGIQNIKKAIITTGENNDTIKGSAKSLEANTLAYGIFNDGIIDTGNGYDILTGQATNTIGGTAYGIYGQGIIRTGDGNDKVIASSNINKVQQKVTIGGGIRFELGTGNDYFKGFGSAIVDGGKGFDTLDVSTFKRSEVSVSGVISGKSLNPANITFNNNGNLITLSTTGFENFIFADSSFSYSRLT